MTDTLRTDDAPEAVGAYSQGTIAGDIIFTSGQVGLHPEEGHLVADDVEAEVRQALNNLLSVIGAAGADAEDLARTTVYLTDLEHYDVVNRVYEDLLPSPLPARSVVEVAGLPAGARVEIEGIAET